MKLTHYFSDINNDKNNEPFVNITDCDEKTQENISKILAQKHGRALQRFKNYETYYLKRKETEDWLRNRYEMLFGFPPKENPFYFKDAIAVSCFIHNTLKNDTKAYERYLEMN